MRGKPGLRLLVVDEQREYFEHIRECAELCRHQFGIECDFTASGAAIQEKLSEWRPTVVLLDMHLPDANTFDILKRCKEGEVSVIVTSDHMSTEISESAREHGATGYVSKSSDPEDIEALLTQIATLAPEIRFQH